MTRHRPSAPPASSLTPLSLPSQQVSKQKADADPVDAVVIVDEALAVAIKPLRIAAEPAVQRKTHAEFDGAVVAAAAQVIAGQERELKFFVVQCAGQIKVPHVLLNVWIVIAARIV